MSKKTLLPTLVLAVLLLGLTYAFTRYRISEMSPVSPITSGFTPKESLSNKIKNALEPKSALQKLLDQSVKEKEGTYGIYVKNLIDSKGAAINTERQFQSASLYKLWLMAAAYQMQKDGKLPPDEELAANKFDLYQRLSLDTDEKLKEENLSYTVKNAIEQMIIVSDNDAAYLLTARVGISEVDSFLKKYQFNNSNIAQPPVTTAKDIASFFEKLYGGEIIDRQNSDKMLELLKRQRLNDRIPKNLPENVKVAHKTGELDTFKHDAGIVFGEKPYILVILTDTKNPPEAVGWMANFSKQLFDYFESVK